MKAKEKYLTDALTDAAFYKTTGNWPALPPTGKCGRTK